MLKTWRYTPEILLWAALNTIINTLAHHDMGVRLFAAVNAGLQLHQNRKRIRMLTARFRFHKIPDKLQPLRASFSSRGSAISISRYVGPFGVRTHPQPARNGRGHLSPIPAYCRARCVRDLFAD